MIPAEHDFTIYEGAAFEKRMQLQTDAGGAIDLTGATISMQVRQGTSAVVDRDWSAYITNGGSDGIITINVPSAQTLAFDYSKGTYDIEILTSSGETHKLLFGNAKIVQETTQ